MGWLLVFLGGAKRQGRDHEESGIDKGKLGWIGPDSALLLKGLIHSFEDLDGTDTAQHALESPGTALSVVGATR